MQHATGKNHFLNLNMRKRTKEEKITGTRNVEAPDPVQRGWLSRTSPHRHRSTTVASRWTSRPALQEERLAQYIKAAKMLLSPQWKQIWNSKKISRLPGDRKRRQAPRVERGVDLARMRRIAREGRRLILITTRSNEGEENDYYLNSAINASPSSKGTKGLPTES